MKKTVLSILALLLVQTTFAQRHPLRKSDEEKKKEQEHYKLFVSGGIGYGFENGGQVYDINGNPYSGSVTYANNGTSTDHFNVKKASLFSGAQATLGLRYMINPHIGIALNGDMGIAPTKYTYNGYQASLGGSLGDQKVVEYAKTPAVLIPALYLQTNGRKMNLYARIGVALGLSTKTAFEETDNFAALGPETGGAETDRFNYQSKSKFAVGFSSALGVSYKLNDRFKVWVEGSLLSMSVYPKETTLSSAVINGQPQSLAGATPNKLGLSGSTNATTGDTTYITEGIPFSNVGLKVGISIALF